MIKNYLLYIIMNMCTLVSLIIVLMIGVAFLTLLERKLLGYVQYRKGPNKVGLGGLFQPFSDAIKLFIKEVFFVYRSSYYLYYISPILGLLLMLMMWLVYPVITNIYFMNYSILIMLIFMSIMSFVILFMGWSSNSMYSMMGALRAVAQVLSYEVSMFFIFVIMMILMESYSLIDLGKWQIYVWNIVYLFPIFMVFFVSFLAEMNRTPMDFIEGESELVSGFNIEYFSGGFTLIFLGEYGMIIFYSMILSLMFFKVNLLGLFVLEGLICCLVIFMRGLLPRMRYDELMNLCWKIILPLVLSYTLSVIFLKSLMSNVV